MRGPRLVSEAEMAPTECTSWATCKDLALMGWTAISPCSSCAATDAEYQPYGDARTIGPVDAVRAPGDTN
jgi:hypothetical protein